MSRMHLVFVSIISLLVSAALHAQCTTASYFRQIGVSISAMAARDSCLIIAQPGIIEILDASTPSLPVRLSSFPITGETTAMEVQGDLLFISTWDFFDQIGSLVLAHVAITSH